MRNTASISIADQQVDEISNVINIFYKGSRAVKHEIAVECKQAIDLQFSHVKEKNRLHEAMIGKDFVNIMDAKVKRYGLPERD